MHACMHTCIHTYIHTYIHIRGFALAQGTFLLVNFAWICCDGFESQLRNGLSFKMRLSFWLQLTYWYDEMRNKDWHFRVAWPGGELSTSRVTGRCLIHYTTSDSVNYDGFTRTLSSVNIKSTNFEEKNHTRDITGTGTFTKSGPALSLKDRLWTSFSVRCLQYIPSKENGQMWKLGSGLGFPYGGLQ